ncbi:hypothetical protein ANN_18767 [Periplaneta americana]|uniref:Endonuclease/exonuclease/phosphatase domain-containing protein n=1 Tax=Periplaneta americana TaxID=6978 RepID=A0ABQ8SRT5_PERAM|nr:hypothetical protein ANN_18767 [Periplaneta americana]
MLENKVLRKIYRAKRDEVTGEWRKLHNTELHALYSSPDIIRNIKSRRLRWAGHVACMGESRNAYRMSAAIVVIAVSRMHYLVRRWRQGRRIGSNVALSRGYSESALSSTQSSYHGPRRRDSSTSLNSLGVPRMSSQGCSTLTPSSRDRPMLRRWETDIMHMRSSESIAVPSLGSNHVAEFMDRFDQLQRRLGLEDSEIINDSEIFRSDYRVFRKDRSEKGGGVFVCTKIEISSNLLWIHEEVEILNVQIRNGRETLDVIACYRPPSELNNLTLHKLNEYLNTVSEDRNVVIAGDLNLPKINWSGISGTNSDAQTLVNELIWRKDFTQVVNGPTRDNALLDVYLLRPVSLFVNSESLHKISDHNSVLLEIFWENTVNPRSSPLSVWNFNKTDVHELQTFLRQKHDDFLRTEGNMENVWHKFKSIIFEALVKCVPSKIIKKNPDPEYYTNYIRYLKKKTRRAFSKRKRSHEHWEKYVELIKKLECEKRSGCVTDHECEPNSTFKITSKGLERITKLKNRKSRGPDSIATEILKLGSEAIIPYLMRIFHVSINNAAIPCDWKSAIVVPIHKGGNKLDVGNYRPISLTSVVCKVMEHLISDYIRHVLNAKDWFYNRQHGFREGFSCDSQITSLVQDLAEEAEESMQL